MALASFNGRFSPLLSGEILRRWDLLTSTDLNECGVDRSKLIRLLETRYGYAQRRAEKEVELFFGDFHERLKMAA